MECVSAPQTFPPVLSVSPHCRDVSTLPVTSHYHYIMAQFKPKALHKVDSHVREEASLVRSQMETLNPKNLFSYKLFHIFATARKT